MFKSQNRRERELHVDTESQERDLFALLETQAECADNAYYAAHDAVRRLATYADACASAWHRYNVEHCRGDASVAACAKERAWRDWYYYYSSAACDAGDAAQAASWNAFYGTLSYEQLCVLCDVHDTLLQTIDARVKRAEVEAAWAADAHAMASAAWAALAAHSELKVREPGHPIHCIAYPACRAVGDAEWAMDQADERLYYVTRDAPARRAQVQADAAIVETYANLARPRGRARA